MWWIYIYIYIYYYYIENNNLFRRLIMAIFRLYMNHLVSSYTNTHTHTHTHIYISGDRGSTVVKVLCYKSLVRSQLVSVDFSLT